MVMNPANKDDNIKGALSSLTEDFKEKIKEKIPEKFDLSIIGKIDLAEAEIIAGEEVIFLTESDLIEGLEDFELVPIKNYKDISSIANPNKTDNSKLIDEVTDVDEKIVFNNSANSKTLEDISKIIKPIDNSLNSPKQAIENSILDFKKNDSNAENTEVDLQISTEIITESNEILDLAETIELKIDQELSEELPIAKKLFKVKINEETLDAQLSSILNIESIYKTDDKIPDKFSEIFPNKKCRFIDDQFLLKKESEDTVSYNEDPLTERLVKMIEVSDGKLELLEISSDDSEHFNYILEDYTLYNSEKFDNVFKEEVFYTDSDFEFIDNAIIRDDFTKYIHEIDDYFESEESHVQSEISEILGLIPDENDYIEGKLFGDYYKKFDLDNEIDFIKPEIDFFRSNYTGIKNLNYFTEDENSLSEMDRKSIEEDISSPNGIVFEENISEIKDILNRDFHIDSAMIENIKSAEIDLKVKEEIQNITDKIVILEDREKLMELAAEFPEKHDNLIRLLSYLDGLFEKLPEEVIRKFAESEYFELYSKVLKEMGV